MATRYQIVLKDQAGTQVAVITDWRSLTYNKVVNGLGSYTLIMDGEDSKVDLFELDGIVEVHRVDLAATPVIDLYADFEALHRDSQRAFDASGLSTFTSQGLGFNDLLNRRVVFFRTGTAGAAKSGSGETVMKEYVDENAGSGATSPPRVEGGVFPGFSVDASANGGGAWEGDRAFKNLLDVVREISEATDVDFQVVSGAADYSFRFTAQARPIGTDRSVGNPDGNPPVIFALDRGNMEIPRFSEARRGEKTKAIVLGQGQPGSRTIATRVSSATTDSPLNLIEVVKNANQEDTTAALNNVGDAALETLQARETFDFQVLQTESARYGRDYFVGDIVTGRFKTIQRNIQIVGVEVRVEPGIGEQIAVTLSDVP